MDIHRIPNTFSNQNSAIKLHLKKYRGWLYPQHIPQIPRYIWAYYNDLTATSKTTMVNKGNHSTIALVQVSFMLRPSRGKLEGYCRASELSNVVCLERNSG